MLFTAYCVIIKYLIMNWMTKAKSRFGQRNGGPSARGSKQFKTRRNGNSSRGSGQDFGTKPENFIGVRYNPPSNSSQRFGEYDLSNVSGDLLMLSGAHGYVKKRLDDGGKSLGVETDVVNLRKRTRPSSRGLQCTKEDNIILENYEVGNEDPFSLLQLTVRKIYSTKYGDYL